MLSILTDPIPIGRWFLPETLRAIGRSIKRGIIKPKFNYGKYRGHFAVTRSLISGLSHCNLPHNYNVTTLSKLSSTVLVLAGVRTLEQAIYLKQKGIIKKLYAGPNICDFPTDYESILLSDEIDMVITPSEWVKALYLQISPKLHNKCIAWPAGVDLKFWENSTKADGPNVLIYIKHNKPEHDIVGSVINHLVANGYNVKLMYYGKFTQYDYLKLLQTSNIMVGFSMGGSESQGIAWAEAWAANVPTLIFKNDRRTYRDVSFACATAPYINASVGAYFTDLNDFILRLNELRAGFNKLSPRRWVSFNMSDEVCAKKLYETMVYS